MYLDSVGPEENPQGGPDPKPWDQQPGEPPDHFGWFKVYLTLPIPRNYVRVAEIVGANPASGWIGKIADKWRWKERAAALDADCAQRLAVLSELRSQALKDAAFNAQYQGLRLTGRALQNAAVGEMDRDEARRYLSALFQHQLGLLRLLTPRKKKTGRKEQTGRIKISEKRLEGLVKNRAMEIREERIQPLLDEIYGTTEDEDSPDPEQEAGNSPATAEQEETQK